MTGLHMLTLSETIMPGHRPNREFVEEDRQGFKARLRAFVQWHQLRIAPGPHSQASDPIESYFSAPNTGPLEFRGTEWRKMTLEYLE